MASFSADIDCSALCSLTGACCCCCCCRTGVSSHGLTCVMPAIQTWSHVVHLTLCREAQHQMQKTGADIAKSCMDHQLQWVMYQSTPSAHYVMQEQCGASTCISSGAGNLARIAWLAVRVATALITNVCNGCDCNIAGEPKTSQGFERELTLPVSAHRHVLEAYVHAF